MTVGHRCGDNVEGPGEACDDGNNVDTDACRNNREAARRGDGVAQAGVRPAMTATTTTPTPAATTALYLDGATQAAGACKSIRDNNLSCATAPTGSTQRAATPTTRSMSTAT